MTSPSPGDRGYNPPAESVLRAIRAEARRAERIRIADLLIDAAHQTSHEHGNSHVGRRRYGLDTALTLVGTETWYAEGPWDRDIGQVSSEIDGVDVGVHTEPDEAGQPDAWPVRLRVFDGGDGVTATAYLTPAEAREAAEALTLAAEAAEKALGDTTGGEA